MPEGNATFEETCGNDLEAGCADWDAELNGLRLGSVNSPDRFLGSGEVELTTRGPKGVK